MRRKPGTVLPNELELLATAAGLASAGTPEFHGFLVAQEMRGRKGGRDLIAYGNLYRILERLERGGFLTSDWEEAAIAETARRPRRRLYRLTGAALEALQQAGQPQPAAALGLQT